MAQHPDKVIGWFEVFSPDKASALSFYKNVFGFGTEDMDMGEMGVYTMWTDDTSTFGAIVETNCPQMEGIPPHINVYFTTGDIDASMAAVKENGGDVRMGPIDIPGGGQIAMCVDNQGAAFSLVDEKGNGSTEYSKSVTWVENMSPDRQKTIDFYSKVLGWNHTEEDMGEVGMYSMFGRGQGFSAGAMQNNDPNIPPCWTMYFYTPDCDASIAKIQSNGGQIMFGPEDIPQVGRIAMGTDCCGAMLAVHQPASM